MNEYLQNGTTFRWGLTYEPLNPEKLALLNKHLNGKVLDIGCAVGNYTNYARSIGTQAIGVDTQADFIKQAQKSYPECEFIKATAYKLPFSRKSFDSVIMFDIIEHLDDVKAIKEAMRVGKRLIISVPHSNQDFLTKHSLAHHHYLDRSHLRAYTKESLTQLLVSLGLKIVYCQPALPISVHAFALDYFAGDNFVKKFILRVILKLFGLVPPIYSTVFAVADVR